VRAYTFGGHAESDADEKVAETTEDEDEDGDSASDIEGGCEAGDDDQDEENDETGARFGVSRVLPRRTCIPVDEDDDDDEDAGMNECVGFRLSCVTAVCVFGSTSSH
jgi:hypothetical protein